MYLYIVKDEFKRDIFSKKQFTNFNIEFKETYNDFINGKNANYNLDDLLILLDENLKKRLENNEIIETYEVNQIGWYYEKNHYFEYNKLILSTKENSIFNLLEKNPKLKIDSFYKYRNNQLEINKRNVLAGSFGLLYYFNKGKINNLFKKFKTRKENEIFELILDKNSIENNDYITLANIFLIQNPKLKENLFKDNMAVKTYADILFESMNYFLLNKYNPETYLEFLIENKNINKSVKDEIIKLNEQIKIGFSYNSTLPFVSMLNEFVHLSKLELEILKPELKNNKHSNGAISLLGMYHSADRLEDNFKFSNFILDFILINNRYFIDVRLEENNFILSFEYNEKTKLLSEYFLEIENYEKIKNKIELQTIEIDNLQTIKNELNIQNNFLEKEIEEKIINLIDKIPDFKAKIKSKFFEENEKVNNDKRYTQKYTEIELKNIEQNIKYIKDIIKLNPNITSPKIISKLKGIGINLEIKPGTFTNILIKIGKNYDINFKKNNKIFEYNLIENN